MERTAQSFDADVVAIDGLAFERRPISHGTAVAQLIRKATMYDGAANSEGPMQPVPGPTRLTYDDLLLLPDDGLRHELIDGEHYVSPSPTTRHQALVGRLYFEIELCLRQRPGIGQVFLAPLDVVFTKWDVVDPDVLFVARDQLGVIRERNIHGAPALVVEVLSESTRRRDELDKRQLFDRGGVREYWIVDPDRDVITIYRRNETGTLGLAAQLWRERMDVLSTPLIPGFAVRLTDLLAR